jgi:hypothetical protein
MAELQGSAAKAAYRKSVTWGTAVALGDGDQVEYASESIVPDVQLIDSDQINGQALPGASDTGAVIVQGDLAGMDGKYSGHERFFRDVFGQNVSVIDGDGFKHKMDFLTSNEGFYGTLAFEKVVDAGTHTIHEIDSWKPMGLTFDGAAGQPVKLTVRGIGRELQPGESTFNTASTSWTLPGKGAVPEERRLVKFGQTIIEIAEAPVALTATGYYTYTAVNPTAGDFVTVNGRVYTFVVSPAVNDDVEIAGTSDLTALNLERAINMSGGINAVAGDYLVVTANAVVTAYANPTLNRVILTSILAGVVGNTYTITESSTEYGSSGATLTGGVAGSSYVDLCASAFNISLQRNGEPVQTTCDGDFASEPSTDTVEISGTLEFPIYDDDNHFLVEANISKAVLSLRFTFTHPDFYSNGKPYKIVLIVPGVQLTGGYPNVGGRGRVPLSVAWRAHNAENPADIDATMPRLYVYNDTVDIDDFGNF